MLSHPLASTRELGKLAAPLFNVPEDNAIAFLHNHRTRIESGVGPSFNPFTVAGRGLDDLVAKRKVLEAQLAALLAEEQKLIEAKKLKLLPCWDGKGVLIKKEGSQLGVMIVDIPELIDGLTAFYADHDTKHV